MKNTIVISLFLCFSCLAIGQTVSCGTSFLTSDWNNIGPYQSSLAYMGRVTSIWVDEEDHNAEFILAGTRGSGIWKTTDGGDNWSNTSGFQLPAAGITNIEQYKPLGGSNHFYSTTSFNGSDRNVYHEGIIYSTDNASTWNLMGSYPDGYLREGELSAFGSRKIKLRPTTSDLWVAKREKNFCI
jgi:hypothetical protein